ncbi:hypothetical protein JKP88DRAFT_275486 [Tribonema minus]|uniref:Uncharacterized protein n=1 Tax=Tribonema minus TaxID=303371 RepID=A0A836CKR3_9STRA|nr:hypothetical protein JKP88DRAFT_275486 [Tribonema minus]
MEEDVGEDPEMPFGGGGGFRLSKIPKQHSNRSPIYDWGVCVVRNDAEDDRATLWFCRVNEKCCAKKGISITGSNSNATRHLKDEHGILSSRARPVHMPSGKKQNSEKARSGHAAALAAAMKKILPLNFFQDPACYRLLQLPSDAGGVPVLDVPTMRALIGAHYTKTVATVTTTLADRAAVVSTYLPSFHVHLPLWSDAATGDQFIALQISYTAAAEIGGGTLAPNQLKAHTLAVRPYAPAAAIAGQPNTVGGLLVTWAAQVLREFGVTETSVLSVTSNSSCGAAETMQAMFEKHRGVCIVQAVADALAAGFGVDDAPAISRNRAALDVLGTVRAAVICAKSAPVLQAAFADVSVPLLSAALSPLPDLPPQRWPEVAKALKLTLAHWPQISQLRPPAWAPLWGTLNPDTAFELYGLLAPAADLIKLACTPQPRQPRGVETLVNLTQLWVTTLDLAGPLVIPSIHGTNIGHVAPALSVQPHWDAQGRLVAVDPAPPHPLRHGGAVESRMAQQLSDVCQRARILMKQSLGAGVLAKAYGGAVPDPSLLVLDMQAMLHPRLRLLTYLKHVCAADGGAGAGVEESASAGMGDGNGGGGAGDVGGGGDGGAANSTEEAAIMPARDVAAAMVNGEPAFKRQRMDTSGAGAGSQDRLSALQELGILDADGGEGGAAEDSSRNPDLQVLPAEEVVRDEETRYMAAEGYNFKDLQLSDGLSFWQQEQIIRLFPNLASAAHALYGMAVNTCPAPFDGISLGLAAKAFRHEFTDPRDSAYLEMLLFLHENMGVNTPQPLQQPPRPEGDDGVPMRMRGADAMAISDLSRDQDPYAL